MTQEDSNNSKHSNFVQRLWNAVDIRQWYWYPLVDPSNISHEKISRFYASGLTAKELVYRLSYIKEKEIRDGIGEQILPSVLNPNGGDLPKEFGVSYVDRLNHDSHVGDDIKIYYARGILKCVGKKYDLAVTYYYSDTPIAYRDLMSYFQQHDSIKTFMNDASERALETCHFELEQVCPQLAQEIKIVNKKKAETVDTAHKTSTHGSKSAASIGSKANQVTGIPAILGVLNVMSQTDDLVEQPFHFNLTAADETQLHSKLDDIKEKEIRKSLRTKIGENALSDSSPFMEYKISFVDDIPQEKDNDEKEKRNIYFAVGILKLTTEKKYDLTLTYYYSSEQYSLKQLRSCCDTHKGEMNELITKIFSKLYDKSVERAERNTTVSAQS